MERGAEPWSWVLETSSAGSHDFHPGVGLRREGPHVPLGSFSLPRASHKSPCGLRQEKDPCGSSEVGSEAQPGPLSNLCSVSKRDTPCLPKPTSTHPVLILQILPQKQLALPHLGCGARSWSGTQATKVQDPLMKSLTQTQKTWTPTQKSLIRFLKTHILTQKTSTLSLKTQTTALKIYSWDPSIWTPMWKHRAPFRGTVTRIPKILIPCLQVLISIQTSSALSLWFSTLTATRSAPQKPQT